MKMTIESAWFEMCRKPRSLKSNWQSQLNIDPRQKHREMVSGTIFFPRIKQAAQRSTVTLRYVKHAILDSKMFSACNDRLDSRWAETLDLLANAHQQEPLNGRPTTHREIAPAPFLSRVAPVGLSPISYTYISASSRRGFT
jgi:hypothetical protein